MGKIRIIGGQNRAHRLKGGWSQTTRPTRDKVRQAAFNILEHGFQIEWSLQTVLDVFAGTGAYGFEALSRGARTACFVEQNPSAATTLWEEAQFFGDRALVLRTDTLRLTQMRETNTLPGEPFSLCFIDPPYRHNLLVPALLHLAKKGWIDTNSLIVAEYGHDESIIWPDCLEAKRTEHYGMTHLTFLSLAP